MRILVAFVIALTAPSLALAQAPQSPPPAAPPEENEWVTPPLIETPAAPAPKQEEPAASQPSPPPPQGSARTPAPTSLAPPLEPPGPEIGLMISEAAFGMLTAAGTSLLAYYLFLKTLVQPGGGLPIAGADTQTLSTVLFLLGFGGVPLAVAQTEVGIANGSYYYSSESWPAALSGLGAQGAVLGLYFLVRNSLADRGEAVLLIGTCVAVPLVQMAVINLTKRPRWQLPGGGLRSGPLFSLAGGRMELAVPWPAPAILRGPRGLELGAQLPLAGGEF